MASDDQVGLLDPDKSGRITVTSLDTLPSSYHGRHRRNSSNVEEMMYIDENQEEDFSNDRRYGNDTSYDLGQPPQDYNIHQRAPDNPSMIRRLTTKLRSPLPGTPSWSNKKSKGKQYANLQGEDVDHVAIDLSVLAGSGFELKEMNNMEAHPDHDQADAQTASASDGDQGSYSSATFAGDKPDFNTWRKRRTLGSGMVIGAQLKRDPSKAIRRDSSVVHHDGGSDSVHRSRTVRDIGQNLAEDRNIIVAVSAPIDISSLDGTKGHHGQTFDSLTMNRNSMIADDPQSYFFPTDPKVPNWRPFSMRKPYIILLIFLALGLAGGQEFLYQVSQQMDLSKGGLLAFDKVSSVSIWDFFVWKYLPTVVTIIYAVLYSIMDFDIRRLEPYYQLSQRDGSRASASLNLDHLTMFQYFVPFNALRLRQWAVFGSTFANILASTIAPALQNPSVEFIQNSNCNSTCPEGEFLFYVRINPIWSRLLSSAYLIVAIILTFLFFQLRRKSGLLNDPKGIAGVASMATKSHILQDFKGLDLATRGKIHRRLAHRRYVLYKSSIWQGEWMSNSEPPQDSERRLRSPHPVLLRLVAGIPFLLLLFFCLGAVPVISLTKARIVPNKAPWLPILVATTLKMLWSTFEADVRLIEPFYQLSLGNALPQNSLTLDYQSTVYGWMPIRAMLNGHFLVALVGICSVALDVLSVTVSSFSVDSQVFLHRPLEGNDNISDQDQTYISFWTSEALSIFILLFTISTTILVYARRRHPFLPREPSTIAAVLAFIYASKMLDDFIDTETLDSAALAQRLKETNKRYGLGWFRGRDHQIHCAIDEEPMTSRYVHGKPYALAVAGPGYDGGEAYA